MGRVADEVGIEDATADLIQCLREDLDEVGNPSLLSNARFESRCECWGVAYVMEGSAMGGRQILKSISTRGDSADFSTRYLSHLVAGSKGRWPKFLAALEIVDCDDASAVSAATSAFEYAYEVFSENMEQAGITMETRKNAI
jgi:heme oxygenase